MSRCLFLYLLSLTDDRLSKEQEKSPRASVLNLPWHLRAPAIFEEFLFYPNLGLSSHCSVLLSPTVASSLHLNMLFRERKAELHVEVLRQPTPSDHSIFIPHAAIEEKILEWLQKTFAGFFINTYVNAPNNDMPPYAHLIESIRIVDYSGPGSPHDYHALDEVTPVVHVYMLREPQEAPKEQRAQKTQHLDLPSKALAGTWDSLMFDTIDPNQILRSLARISTTRKWFSSA